MGTKQTNTKKQKIRAFHGLLAKTKMMHAKEFILNGQDVDSTKDLTDEQLDFLIDYLLGLLSAQKKDADKEIRRWRSKVLRVMTKCNVDTNDWNAVNAFMLQPRVAGKHLYKFKEIDELKKLHRKLNKIAENMDKKRAELQRLAMYN